MDNIQKEIDTYIHKIHYMNNNYDRLPPILQIKYLEEVMKFGESIKPIYITGIALLGDYKKGDTENE